MGAKFWLLSYNSVLVVKIRRMYISLNPLLRTGLVLFFFSWTSYASGDAHVFRNDVDLSSNGSLTKDNMDDGEDII